MNRIDNSQRTAAKIAGVTGLLAMAIVVVGNYALLSPLVVPGNAAETARNIVSHQTQVRVALTCFLMYSASVVVLLAALFGLAVTVCSYWFDSPMALFELVVSFWLLFKELPRQNADTAPP